MANKSDLSKAEQWLIDFEETDVFADPGEKLNEAYRIIGEQRETNRLLLDVARAGKRLSAAVKLYLKHSNSPVCIGWDEMLDALTEYDAALTRAREAGAIPREIPGDARTADLIEAEGPE
jgi:hypothetical protein